jgi:hypothetical protein
VNWDQIEEGDERLYRDRVIDTSAIDLDRSGDQISGIVSVLSPLLSVPPAGVVMNCSFATVITKSVPTVATVNELSAPIGSESLSVSCP